MALTRTLTGLLFRDNFDRADAADLGTNWEGPTGGDAVGYASIVTNQARVNTADSATTGQAYVKSGVFTSPDMVVEALVTGVSSTDHVGRYRFRLAVPTPDSSAQAEVVIDNPSPNENKILLVTDGTTQVTSVGFTAAGVGVVRHFKASLVGDLLRGWQPRDPTTPDGVPLVGYTRPAGAFAAGRVGLMCWHTNVNDFNDLRVYRNHGVTVRGIPTGSIAEVIRADGTVVASATESGGTAVVNLTDFSVPYAGFTSIRVVSSGGAVLETATPSGGVWGGDEYKVAETYSDEVLADNPLGYWPMQEATGATTVVDNVSARNFTLSGATSGAAGILASEPGATSISFDGTDDFLRQAIDAAFKVSVVTLEFLYRTPAALPSANGALVAMDPAGTNADGRGIRLLLLGASHATDPSKLYFQKGSAAGEFFVNLMGGLALAADTTYHIVAVVGAGVMKEYRNGALGTSNANADAINWTDAAAGNFPTPGQFYVAASRNNLSTPDNVSANQSFHTGRISHLAIYSGELPATRITAHYNATAAAAGGNNAAVTTTLPALTGAVAASHVAPSPDRTGAIAGTLGALTGAVAGTNVAPEAKKLGIVATLGALTGRITAPSFLGWRMCAPESAAKWKSPCLPNDYLEYVLSIGPNRHHILNETEPSLLPGQTGTPSIYWNADATGNGRIARSGWAADTPTGNQPGQPSLINDDRYAFAWSQEPYMGLEMGPGSEGFHLHENRSWALCAWMLPTVPLPGGNGTLFMQWGFIIAVVFLGDGSVRVRFQDNMTGINYDVVSAAGLFKAGEINFGLIRFEHETGRTTFWLNNVMVLERFDVPYQATDPSFADQGIAMFRSWLSAPHWITAQHITPWLDRIPTDAEIDMLWKIGTGQA